MAVTLGMIHDAQPISIVQDLPVHLQSGASEFRRRVETVREIIVVPVVAQVQMNAGRVKGMKELAVFLVGTQRGTNPGRRVNAAVWRAHLVRVILPQHFRELDVERLEYSSLRAALEFHDVIALES